MQDNRIMKNEEKKISPDEYRRLLDKIELKEISLLKCSANLNNFTLKERNKVKFTQDHSFISKDDDLYIIHQSYKITSGSEKPKKELLSIEATYQVQIESAEPLSEEFFDIYMGVSLPLNVWPFFREFAFSISTRMALPPLTLPLMKR
jgi:hypothetical protein